MIIPIRCFCCGKPIGAKWGPYSVLLEAGFNESDALEYLGLKRICCRRMLLTHIEHIDRLVAYDQKKDEIHKTN